MAHQVTKSGFPIDPKLREMEFRLGDLAADWRGAHGNAALQTQLVFAYHALMRELYALEWDGILDIESELPDELMPRDYMNRHHR